MRYLGFQFLILQPDLGQTILLFITILCLVFVQGFPWLIIAPAGLVSMISIIFFYFNFPHFASRLDSWIEIWFGGGVANSKLTQTQAAIDAIDPTAQNYTAPTITIPPGVEDVNVNLSGKLSATTGGGDKVGAFLVYLTHSGNGTLKDYLVGRKLIEIDGLRRII